MIKSKLQLSSHEKINIALLIALAIICIIFVASPISSGDMLLFFLSFPYAQIGLLLRGISLLGNVGSVIAYMLYFATLGVGIYYRAYKMEREHEDTLLFLTFMLLMWALFYLANPGRFPMAIPDVQIQNAVIGGTIHSMLLAYFILKLARYFSESEFRRLEIWMGWGLYFLGAIFVITVFGVVFDRIVVSFEALRAGNIGNEHRLGLTYLFIIARHMVNSLPFLLNIWVIFAAQRLLNAFREDPYNEKTITAAKYVATVCKKVLVITVFSSAIFHFAQFFAVSRLMDVHMHVTLPITAVLFMLGALIFSRYIAENKQLKDENEGFI